MAYYNSPAAYQCSNQTKKSGRVGGRQALVKRLSSERHVPGKMVGRELQANTSFQAGLTGKQAPQKVVGQGYTV
eukprot:5059960-Heterocapsa_arctica.AAC.1